MRSGVESCWFFGDDAKARRLRLCFLIVRFSHHKQTMGLTFSSLCGSFCPCDLASPIASSIRRVVVDIWSTPSPSDPPTLSSFSPSEARVPVDRMVYWLEHFSFPYPCSLPAHARPVVVAVTRALRCHRWSSWPEMSLCSGGNGRALLRRFEGCATEYREEHTSRAVFEPSSSAPDEIASRKACRRWRG